MEVLESIELGTQGWNAVMTTNFEKIEEGLLPFLNDLDLKDAEVQIKSVNNDDSVVFSVKNSDGVELFTLTAEKSAEIEDIALETTETAGDNYTATEKSMLDNLKTDVTSLKDAVNDILALLRALNLIDVGA
jgi:hypothetical protein